MAANLRRDPRVEVKVVDPILRKGYRLAGIGQVFTDGPGYERLMDWFADQRGTDYRTRAHGVVLITVTAVEPLIRQPTMTAAPRTRSPLKARPLPGPLTGQAHNPVVTLNPGSPRDPRMRRYLITLDS